MDERVKLQNDYTRVTEWQDAGWTGAGVTVWDMESPTSDHGKRTHRRVLDAAPDAEVINATHHMHYQGDEVDEAYVYDGEQQVTADEFVRAHGITVLTQSMGGSSDKNKGRVDLYSNLKSRYNLAMFNSAGNDGDDGLQGGALPESLAIYVGACQFVWKRGKLSGIEMCNYSSLGDEMEEVDFSTFVGPAGWSGTSFSTPYLAGIAALLQQRYGKSMTQDEMYGFFRMCAEQIDSGHMATGNYSYLSGYGLPILPPVDKRLVMMQIGRKAYRVDGAWEEMDVAPFIEKQRTYVPIAFAAIALGAQVEWDNDNRKVTILKDGHKLEMTIGKKAYTVDGVESKMDVAPFIRNQRTYVPIAFAALGLNCKVAWVEREQKVLILEQ